MVEKIHQGSVSKPLVTVPQMVLWCLQVVHRAIHILDISSSYNYIHRLLSYCLVDAQQGWAWSVH